MRWLRRRHRHRIITGFQFAWHPILGWHEQIIFRRCACQSPFLKTTTEKEYHHA